VTAEVIADFIATLAFGVAVLIVLRLPDRAPAVGKMVKVSLLAASAVYLFVSLSNVLEHTGILPALDVYEDYAEVLFVPLVAYALYSRLASERLLAFKRAEERVRQEHNLVASIVDTTPAGILVANERGEISFANSIAGAMLAMVADGQLDLAAIVRAAPVTYPSLPVGPADDVRYLSARSTPLAVGTETSTGAVVILVDVTERVKSQEQLEEYSQGLERAIDRRTAELLEVNRELRDASDAKQQFLARMSHELRTPLNSIIGFSEIMLKGLSGSLTTEQETQLGMVKASGTQLLGLVNDILDIARIEAGHVSVTLSTVDLGARMHALVASMKAIAALQGVRVVCQCEQGPGVSTDPDKLDQVVRNLVSNAIKFTDAGGVVTITVEYQGDTAVITVSDTGIGIAPDDLERVFEAFAQIDVPDRVRPEGTGLGLAICRELSQILGYDLALESVVDQGTTFTIRIPREYGGDVTAR